MTSSKACLRCRPAEMSASAARSAARNARKLLKNGQTRDIVGLSAGRIAWCRNAEKCVGERLRRGKGRRVEKVHHVSFVLLVSSHTHTHTFSCLFTPRNLLYMSGVLIWLLFFVCFECVFGAREARRCSMPLTRALAPLARNACANGVFVFHIATMFLAVYSHVSDQSDVFVTSVYVALSACWRELSVVLC
jgi:hypothetical protein